MINNLEDTDFSEVLHMLKTQYGYDFTGYMQASVRRRMLHFMGNEAVPSVFELKHRLVNDAAFLAGMVQFITVNVTEMFRDPAFFATLKTLVLPKLAAYPIIKIWHAGCATGEEALSMAILLHEAGLLERARIYATDLNPANLERARAGIVPVGAMKQNTFNYIQSGGQAGFSDYYTSRYDNVIFKKELRAHITYSQHNLVTDSSFNEFQLICCRNVFIYFRRELQAKVLQLFRESLSPHGYLALGSKEAIHVAEIREQFDTVHQQHRIYRLK
jgi:chemotaxis protein methyltransferase CheR